MSVWVCECVDVWCIAIDWCHIRGESESEDSCDWNRIHRGLEEDKVATEEWMEVLNVFMLLAWMLVVCKMLKKERF